MSYAFTEDGNIRLNGDFTDFNDEKIINRKRRLLFRKFYIYKDEAIVEMRKKTDNDIEILEIHDNSARSKHTLLVIYLDPKSRLSFIVIKDHHPKLSKEQIIEKAESTPPQRVFICSMISYFYIFGVIRFKYANMKEVSLAFGYDKSLSYKFNYIFPRFIRKRFSAVTNKLSLIVHLGYVRIKKRDLLNKYIETSEVNLPVYVKSTNKDNLHYYYPLKFDYKHKYNQKHYIYSSKSYRLNKTIEFFVRKSITGQMVLVMTDYLSKLTKLKEKLAYLSLFFNNQEKYDIYFEKFARNASESAFELFKKSKEENDLFSNIY